MEKDDLDSFLYPVLKELDQLAEGVQIWDKSTNSEQTLKVHLVIASGDMPARSKLLHTNSSYMRYIA